MKDRVREVMVSELMLDKSIDVAELKYGATRAWDSQGHLNLVVALEEEFGVEFDSDELVKLTSYSAICEHLMRKGVK